MFGNHPASTSGNAVRAEAAWGAEMPAWVRLLASACDATNQKAAGERIGRSGGYVSRVLSRSYGGSYEEAETLVRAAFGTEELLCPIWGEAIPLAACLRARRRTGPPRTSAHLIHDRTCPTCPHNSDAESDHG